MNYVIYLIWTKFVLADKVICKHFHLVSEFRSHFFLLLCLYSSQRLVFIWAHDAPDIPILKSNFDHRRYVAFIIGMWRLLLVCGGYSWYVAVILGMWRLFMVCGAYSWYVAVILSMWRLYPQFFSRPVVEASLCDGQVTESAYR